MAKGNPYLMMGYGGIKRPGPPTPRLPSGTGQDLVNKIRGNASLRRKKKKKKGYA